MPVLQVPAGEEGGPEGLPNPLKGEEHEKGEEEKKEDDDGGDGGEEEVRYSGGQPCGGGWQVG